MKIHLFKVLPLLIIYYSLGSVYAQQTSGSLIGTISDINGQPIVNASILMEDTHKGTATDQLGKFKLYDIEPGEHSFKITALGYESVFKSIVINANKEHRLNITLKESSIGLQEVVITAEKRETVLLETPIAISVLSSKKMEDYRLWSMRDLSAVVPNLLISHVGSDLPSYTIRGMYSNARDQAIAVYVDDIMLYDYNNLLNLYNIERVEILRGAQGTLYGRGAMAGVINIITKKPGNTTNGFGEASIGNYGTERYSAGVNTPIVKNKLFVGISGSYNKADGYYTNIFDNQVFDKNGQLEGHLSLRYLPSENWALTLNAKAQKTFNHGTFPYIANDSIALSDGFITDQNVKGVHHRQWYNTSLSIKHHGKWFDVTSITGFQYRNIFIKNGLWDGDWSSYDFYEIGYGGSPKDNSGRTFTQEIRFNSKDEKSSRFNWTTGAFYIHHPEKETTLLVVGEDAGTMLNDPYAPYTLKTPSKLTNDGYAFFGQATYKPTPKLNITAGLRYDRETKVRYTQTTMIKEGLPDTELVERTRLSGKYKALSPKVNVSYLPGKRTMVYANYSRGFRAGGLNAISSDPDLYAYDPEFSNNYELGYKSDWFDQKLFGNLTFFYTDWSDMQVTAFGNTPAETGTRNTGNSRIKGMELEIMTVPLKGLNVDYNFSFNHGRYTKLTKPDVSTGKEIDLKGNWLIMQPEFTSMFAVQYTTNLSKEIKGTIRGEWSSIGKNYLNIENSVKQNPYSLFNTKVGVSYKKTDVHFWARNIFNKRYLSFVYPSGAPYTTLGLPATFGVSILSKF
ncbi:TonB-dependent receptor [Arenibacter sp. M-2]|uniref:TonB-dependent receptor n=1 Tax=Arenibacter sp. M-2 TaxID=3053612 RepID=UPI0025700DF8|nr:TonB-dependent receptor [Arenibacter sp. M-2]MDL5511104.1 TonB-dependent receptor [Arenibacter sp. M-2]